MGLQVVLVSFLMHHLKNVSCYKTPELRPNYTASMFAIDHVSVHSQEIRWLVQTTFLVCCAFRFSLNSLKHLCI